MSNLAFTPILIGKIESTIPQSLCGYISQGYSGVCLRVPSFATSGSGVKTEPLLRLGYICIRIGVFDTFSPIAMEVKQNFAPESAFTRLALYVMVKIGEKYQFRSVTLPSIGIDSFASLDA